MKDTKFVTVEGNEIIPTKSTLTHWCDPASIVTGSSYGNVTYREWCERERARINRRDDSVRILTREEKGKCNGYIALYRGTAQL